MPDHPENGSDQALPSRVRTPPKIPERDDQLPEELVNFSFRATRALRKRVNRASAELEVSIQRMATEALDDHLRRLGF